MYDSAQAIGFGNFTPLDLLGFAQTIGWTSASYDGLRPLRNVDLSNLQLPIHVSHRASGSIYAPSLLGGAQQFYDSMNISFVGFSKKYGEGWDRVFANVPSADDPSVFFNKTHAGSLPVPKGVGPNGGPLQSHHALQQEWAVNNIPGYSPGLAPSVTLKNGRGLPHTIITTSQRQRRDA